MPAVTPISPDQIEKDNEVPDVVISAINEMLSENYDMESRTACIQVSDLLNELDKKFSISRTEVYKYKYLTRACVIFQAYGWNAKYRSDQRDGDYLD